MATPNHSAPLVIETGPPPEISVIFVHGLGTSGSITNRWFSKRIDQPVRFVMPTASRRPVRICDGQVVTAWFDLLTPDFNDHVDVESIR